MIKLILLIFILINLNNFALPSIKNEIINNLINTNNLSFKFEQNINGKIETGNCIIEYPKKTFCKYNKSNDKILVSNGKSLLIKIKMVVIIAIQLKGSLNYILDKNFLINEIKILEERIIDEKFVNYTISRNENEINIFLIKIILILLAGKL